MRVRLVGLVALMGLVLASCGGASPEAGGPSEGIQVHGDWTIDIYNEDGTLDRHVEFSNDLQASGAEALGQILSRNASPGAWMVIVNGIPSDQTPCGTDTPTQCMISELQAEGLTVEPSASGLVLSGSFEATRDGNVGLVDTRTSTCDSSTAPDSCSSTGALTFTRTLVADENGDAINVDAGQQVDIEVEISFTSG